MTNAVTKDLLEALVDAHGLRRVYEELVEVAWDKAEHIEHAWQDEELAKQWKRTASKLGNAVHWKGIDWPT